MNYGTEMLPFLTYTLKRLGLRSHGSNILFVQVIATLVLTHIATTPNPLLLAQNVIS